MKYFTSEWWAAGCEGDASERYWQYIDSVRGLLPAAARELDTKHTLHDSEVKSVLNDFSKKEISINLLGWDRAFQAKVRYILRFSDVSVFEQIYPQDEYVESELGDLGYWEWEVVSSGIELRLLFASSATFRIVFAEFTFSHERLGA